MNNANVENKRLFEIVAERHRKQNELLEKKKAFQTEIDALSKDIETLVRLENIAADGVDVIKVQLAESVISVKGNPYGKTSDGGFCIAECAVIDISTGCTHLKNRFYGNKTYGGYYQRCDCDYGYRPRHGGIVDSVSLVSEARGRDLSEDEKDACIYYLRNYKLISAQKATQP